jgi:hypothetical protein
MQAAKFWGPEAQLFCENNHRRSDLNTVRRATQYNGRFAAF